MTDKEITIKNLKIVLEKLPELAKKDPRIIEDFNMWDLGCYSGTSFENPICGTQGCLLGNAARVLPLTRDLFKTDIKGEVTSFSYTAFNKVYFPYIGAFGSLWSFLFSVIWDGYQPTFEQAMNRLKYAIDMGLELGEWNYQNAPFISPKSDLK